MLLRKVTLVSLPISMTYSSKQMVDCKADSAQWSLIQRET